MFGSPRILFSCLPEFLPRKGRSYPALGCPVRSRGPESIPLTPPHGRRRKPKYTRPNGCRLCEAMHRDATSKGKNPYSHQPVPQRRLLRPGTPSFGASSDSGSICAQAYSDRCRLLVRKQLQASHESQRFFASREIWDYAAVKCQCKA